MEEISLDKWEEATHPIVSFVIGFTEIEIHGFQVLQVSSPDHHQLGRAWVEPRGFVVSEVSWIVRLEESSELRGELCSVVVWFFFPLDFGRSDLALESAKTTISSRNFHSSHPSFKAFKMLFIVLLLDSSKVCPAPNRLRWATVLP